MNKKILYLRTDIHRVPLLAGGSVSHTIGIINGFLDLHYAVLVASSVMHEQLKKLHIQQLIPLQLPIVCYNMGNKIAALWSNIFFTRTTINIITKEQPAFLYQRYSILNVSGVLASKKTHIPLLLEYNGSEVWVLQHWSNSSHIIKKLFMWLVQKIEQYNLRHAHTIIVVSEILRDELIKQQVDAQKIIIIPNGVDTNQYDPLTLASARTIIRHQLALEQKFVFGFIGTFSAWHGINILEQIIPTIITANNRIHFLLIGDGPLLHHFKQTMQRNNIHSHHITYTGIVSHETSKQYLASCDAFLLPTQPNPDGSPFFGSPTKLFEYLSLGKPIIASAIGQIINIINPAITITNVDNLIINADAIGFLVEPTDNEGFINALLVCATLNYHDYTSMGAAARNRAVIMYQWKSHVETIIKQRILV